MAAIIDRHREEVEEQALDAVRQAEFDSLRTHSDEDAAGGLERGTGSEFGDTTTVDPDNPLVPDPNSANQQGDSDNANESTGDDEGEDDDSESAAEEEKKREEDENWDFLR